MPRNAAVLADLLTALVPAALSGRAQTARPAAQVCLGFLREREGEIGNVCVCVCVCVCVRAAALTCEDRSALLYVSLPSLALNGARTRGQRRAETGGPPMMDGAAENTFSAVTAGRRFIHTLMALYLSAKQSA